MSLIQLLIGLILVGVILVPINKYIPMQRTIKIILNIVVILVIVFVFMTFGIANSPVGPHINGRGF
jgi:hypothetical protein